jgi:hypothetical protein
MSKSLSIAIVVINGGKWVTESRVAAPIKMTPNQPLNPDARQDQSRAG